MDRTTLARNLKSLLREGMIRVDSGEDLRERRVSITPYGVQKFNEAFPLWEEAQARVYDMLGKERLDHLLGDLMELISFTRSR